MGESTKIRSPRVHYPKGRELLSYLDMSGVLGSGSDVPTQALNAAPCPHAEMRENGRQKESHVQRSKPGQYEIRKLIAQVRTKKTKECQFFTLHTQRALKSHPFSNDLLTFAHGILLESASVSVFPPFVFPDSQNTESREKISFFFLTTTSSSSRKN